MTTIGVYGAGDSNRRNTTALVKDFVSQFESFQFVLPATVPTFTDAVRHVADLAVEEKYDLAFVADKHDVADLDDYADVPVTQVESTQDVLGDVDHLLVAWSDDISDAWVESVIRKGAKVYDLTDGLFEITVTEDDEATVPVPQTVKEPEPEVVPEQPKPRSRAARNAAKTQAQEPETVAATHPDPVAADAEVIAQRAAEIVLERLRAAL